MRFSPKILLAGIALFTAQAAHPDPNAQNQSDAPAVGGCLPSGNGFLRARMRGALNLDIDWRDGELECDGSQRPDGQGIRMSFAGPPRSDGRRLRLVFGVGEIREGSDGRALPTNLTIIFEGEKRLFATRGDDKCTVDKLVQERVGALGGDARTYRIVASGFCTEPANDLGATERVVLMSFDFAGRVTYADLAVPATPADPHLPTSPPRQVPPPDSLPAVP